MYEAEIKTIATWINGKVDILGSRVSEKVEQMMFEWVLTVLVALIPATVKGIPFKSLLIEWAVDWVNSDAPVVEAKLERFAAFVESERKAA